MINRGRDGEFARQLKTSRNAEIPTEGTALVYLGIPTIIRRLVVVVRSHSVEDESSDRRVVQCSTD